MKFKDNEVIELTDGTFVTGAEAKEVLCVHYCNEATEKLNLIGGIHNTIGGTPVVRKRAFLRYMKKQLKQYLKNLKWSLKFLPADKTWEDINRDIDERRGGGVNKGDQN